VCFRFSMYRFTVSTSPSTTDLKKEALAERVEKLSRVRVLEVIRGFQGLYLQTLK
jgi:hypothetical protein